MFKNLVKKIKGVAKKVAPYAGVVAGMFGASPLMAAGIGALGGGLGTGNMKGAVLGGLGGFGSGTMYGGQNRLFNTGLTNKMFGIGDPGTGGFFNPMNKGLGDLLMARSPDQVIRPGSVIPGGTDGIPVDRFIPGENIKGGTGIERFKDILTMENNPLTGKELAEGSMYRYLPAALGGTALAYGLGAFDEEPIPEDEIPEEYKYDASTDPLKNINKRFQDYYQGITQIPSSSIYGYLQSIGALKEGGIPRGYSGGGSMAQKMDVPGQFLLNDPSKSPLSVLEAADGMDTSDEEVFRAIELMKNGQITEEEFNEKFGSIVNEPGNNYYFTRPSPPQKLDVSGIEGLERYVDTGEGEGMDKGVGATKDMMSFIEQGAETAKKVLNLGAEEAIKELGTGDSIGPTTASTVSDDGKRMLDLTKGQEKAVKDGATQVEMTDNQEAFYSSPSDEGKTFGNGEFYYDDPKLIEFIQRRADSNGTTYQEELFKFVDEVEGFYRNKKSNGGKFSDGNPTNTSLSITDLNDDQLQIYNGLINIGYGADEAIRLILDPGPEFLKRKANGGLAAFDQGGKIMGPGTGREDVIPGKIVDKNTGQTSDMLVSNNEHIIPEYALYAMGGGDTKKGHDMMDALRKQTKPMAQDMGYNFKGAEDGSVMYG